MLLSTLVLTLTPTLPFQDAKAAPPLDLLRAVPKDAWAFASVREFDGLRGDFEKHALSGLYQDPDSAGLRGWFEHELGKEGSAAKSGDETGKRMLDLVSSVHGSMALYLGRPPKGTQPEFVVLIDPGSPRAGFEKALDQIHELEAKDKISSTRNYDGVELIVLESKKAEGAAADQAKPRAMAYEVLADAGSFVAWTFSSDPERALELAQASIDRLRGKDNAETVTANTHYIEARSNVSARGRVEVFLDLASFLPFVLAEQKSKGLEQDRMVEALGMKDLGWGYVTGDIGAGELARLEFSLALPEKGILRDMLELFGKLPQDAARAFPKESQGVTLYSVDVPGLWKWVWELVKVGNPQVAEQSQAQLAAAGQALGGVDLEKDIIGQLTGEFGSTTIDVPGDEWLAANGGGATGEEDEEESASEDEMAATPAVEPPKGATLGDAWWIGLRDAKAFTSTLETVLDATGAAEQLETEDFQGKTIWSMPLPTGATLSFSFTTKGMVISQFPSALRAVLRMEGAEAKDSVLEREAFKPLFAENRDAGMFSVTHTAGMLKTIWSALELVSSQLPAMRSGGMVDASQEDNPLRHLPPAETIDRHFQGTSTTTLRHKGRVMMLRFSMR